jgi:type II secretory pathway pseudopilin PulG
MTNTRCCRKTGFTLLEIVLALGLMVIVMALVGAAMNTTLHLVDSGKTKTERDQLARAIMAKIAGDVRATVRYEPFDSSGMMQYPKTSSSSSSTTSSSTTAQNSNTSSTNSSSSSSSSSSDSSSSDSNSSSSTTQTIAGLSGDQYGLIIDIGRLPRIDEYGGDTSTNNSSAIMPSDVRTVTYFLAGDTAPASQVVSSTNVVDGSGLVRCEMDRAMSQYATQQGQSTLQNAAVIAPEILALEFQYFDGTQWDTSWDTTQNSGLPQAVKISMVLADPAHAGQAGYTAPQYASVADAAAQDPDSVYSTVVRLPASDPFQMPPSSSQSSDSSSSSTSSSTSGGTQQ